MKTKHISPKRKAYIALMRTLMAIAAIHFTKYFFQFINIVNIIFNIFQYNSFASS